MSTVAAALQIRDDISDDQEKIDIQIEFQNPETLTYDFEPNCLGNMPVSLFWEEKIVLVIRFLQFYGFFLLIFFEEWPD